MVVEIPLNGYDFSYNTMGGRRWVMGGSAYMGMGEVGNSTIYGTKW
jgi:hypothetical protein